MPNRDIEKLVKKYRVRDGDGFDLKDYTAKNPLGKMLDQKEEAEALLQRGISDLSKLQEKLYAQEQWSVLLIFQAPDAAGKDSTIKHVMSGVNPQGCRVTSFKRPSEEELKHDFMWRCWKNLPERGQIGIFNRSYYEEALVVRVHPDILEKQKLPEPLKADPDIWDHRLKDMRRFERYLARNGTKVIKFFLNVSRDEQKRRLLDRLDTPEKNWKFEAADLKERALWDEYRKAYRHIVRETATEEAPWYIIPADNKWFMRVAVVTAILNELQDLDVDYPALSDKDKQAMIESRKILLAEKD